LGLSPTEGLNVGGTLLLQYCVRRSTSPSKNTSTIQFHASSHGVSLLPEVEHDNKCFCAASAHKVSNQPLSVPDFRTWLLPDSLDRASVPYCLVTVPTPGEAAILYAVRFPDCLPDFDSLHFSLHPTPQGTVVCMSPERSWAADASSVPVSSVDWRARARQFHAVVAMHRLSIVPVVSKAVFKASADLSTFGSDIGVRC
jgi:hypothetical protein